MSPANDSSTHMPSGRGIPKYIANYSTKPVLRELDLQAGTKQPLVANQQSSVLMRQKMLMTIIVSPSARPDSTVRRLQATIGCTWDGNSAEENDLRCGMGRNHEPQPHGGALTLGRELLYVGWLVTAAACHPVKLGSHSGQAAVADGAATAAASSFALLLSTRQLCNVDGCRDGCKDANDIGAAVAVGEDCDTNHTPSREDFSSLCNVQILLLKSVPNDRWRAAKTSAYGGTRNVSPVSGMMHSCSVSHGKQGAFTAPD